MNRSQRIMRYLYMLHCRLQHFGEGDRIPHHKYGIYSKEWRNEREKLIKNVERRKREGNNNNKKLCDCVALAYSINDIANAKKNAKYFCKRSSPLSEKERDFRKIVKLLNKVHKTAYTDHPQPNTAPNTHEVRKRQECLVHDFEQNRHKKSKQSHIPRRERQDIDRSLQISGPAHKITQVICYHVCYNKYI